jgi:hypothetical protein
MPFEILGSLSGIETIAAGSGIREVARLKTNIRVRPLAET